MNNLRDYMMVINRFTRGKVVIDHFIGLIDFSIKSTFNSKFYREDRESYFYVLSVYEKKSRS